MTIGLGMPARPPRTIEPPWRDAWDHALYGTQGFYRREVAADHFRTSVHSGTVLAKALLRLARAHELRSVVDIGAGGGELLATLAALAPDLSLHAVEVAPRPASLPAQVTWSAALPEALEGLVIAHEWLDNVPCHVVEVDDDGEPRIVHVDPRTGRESWGLGVSEPGVPPTIAAWLRRWWPLDGAPPGARAEVGTSRDRAWSDVVRRMGRGIALAVDYGHLREARPPLGSLRSYLHGREVDVLPDGSRDVTAPVAVDSVAQAVGGAVWRQRDALAALGVSGSRPPVRQATDSPREYVAALQRAGQAADLRAAGGLGDFYWVVSGTGGVSVELG